MAQRTIDSIIKFTPYQRSWLDDRSRFKIGMFSRQTGKTFTNCAELVDDCIRAEIGGYRRRWVILSRGERQAKEAMDEAVKPFTKAYYEIYRAQLRGKAPEVHEDEFRTTNDKGETAIYRMFEVVFPGGSRISALPANPDTARGFSANALLDEFGFHADSRKIWGALFPVISKKGLVLRVVSTPNGKLNKFYELMTAEPSIWSRHIVDIYQAVAQGLDRNIDELKAGINDADLWAQEYELKWLDEATAWLDYELISSCEAPFVGCFVRIEYEAGPGRILRPKRTVLEQRGVEPRPTNHPVYVGMDIARKKDLTCIWVAVLIDGVLWPREIITMKRAPFWAQHAELKRIIDRDNPVRVCIDETGMGEAFVEKARLDHGELRIEGVQLSPQNRQTIASKLKDRMEERTFRLIEGDRDTRDDLHSITKVITSTGGVRLMHDGQADGHGDRFWAAGLVCVAAGEPNQPYAYHSVSEREQVLSVLARRRDENENPGSGGFRGFRY